MLGGRVFFGAALLVILVGQYTSDGAAAQNQPGKPATVSPQVRAACDTAYKIAAQTPGVSIRRSTGVFSDDALRQPVLGCRLAISGSFARAKTSGDAATRLRDAFQASGWQEIAGYSADGKDGTAFAFRKARVACLVRGEWNGGADGEPEIPAEDWYKVSVLCTSPVPAEERRQ